MKIGMFTSGYQYYPLEYAFRDARKIGYDYIELWGGRPHAFAPDLAHGDIHQIKHLIEQYEMPVKVYTPEHNAYPYNYMIGPEYQRKESIEYLKICMRMAKEMGAEYTLISTGHAGYTASRKEIYTRLYQSLKELSDYAESTGTKILLESLTTFESNVCTTVNDIQEILEDIHSSSLLGMCDIVVPWMSGEPIGSYFEKLGDWLQHIHFIDSDGISETHVLPGDGCIPLEEVLKEIKNYGYDGNMTIELVTAYIKEPKLYAKIAYDRIQEMLRRIDEY